MATPILWSSLQHALIENEELGFIRSNEKGNGYPERRNNEAEEESKIL